MDFPHRNKISLKKMLKMVFYNSNTMFLHILHIQADMDIANNTRAYKPYTVGGPPAWRLVLAPLAVYSLTTVYIFSVTEILTLYQ